MRDLTPDFLRSILAYEPETGDLIWRQRPVSMFSQDKKISAERISRLWNNRFSGQRAFSNISKSTGYVQGNIGGKVLRGHRVAWAIFYGDWPDGEIDHINGVRADNRIENLRVVDRGANCRNLPISTRNKSGIIGVTWDAARGKWFASIRHNGKTVGLGRYDQISQAAAARKAAEAKFGFHKNHGRIVK